MATYETEGHTHIPLKHGHATFRGENFKPSEELMEALNKMAELAYKAGTGILLEPKSRLTIQNVSVSVCEHCTDENGNNIGNFYICDFCGRKVD